MDIFPVMMDVFSRMTVLFSMPDKFLPMLNKNGKMMAQPLNMPDIPVGRRKVFCRIPSRRQRRTSVPHPLPFSREIRRFLKKVWLKKSDRLNRAEAML